MAECISQESYNLNGSTCSIWVFLALLKKTKHTESVLLLWRKRQNFISSLGEVCPTWPGILVHMNTIYLSRNLEIYVLGHLTTIWEPTFSFLFSSCSLHYKTSNLGVTLLIISGVWSQDRETGNIATWLSCLLLKEWGRSANFIKF